MSRDFNADWVWAKVSKAEGFGVITRDPDDPGGTTKWGFAQRFNTDIDVTTLTEETAYARFYEKWWLKLRCGEFNRAVAWTLVDAAFNQGEGTAIRQFQTALGVRPDGVIGPATIAAADNEDVAELLIEMAAQRNIRISTNAKLKYRRGLFRRVLRVMLECGKDMS